jgi:hypothetical protein
VLKDDSVKMPQKQFYTMPEEIKDILCQYGEYVQQDEIFDNSHYIESDVEKGILIDITSDQFGKSPVYVGVLDGFHKKFEFDFAHDIYNLEDERLISIYQRIFQYI